MDERRYLRFVTWHNTLIVLTTAVALATAVFFVRQWWWGFDVVANFRSYLLLAAGFLVAAAWGARARWFAGVALVCLVVNGALIAPWYTGRPAAPESGPAFSIGHINAQKRNEDAQPLIDAARNDEIGVDVFVILEPGKGWRNVFNGQIGPYTVTHPDGRRPDVFVLSKLPLSSVYRPDDPDLPPPSVVFTVETPLGPIGVMGVDTASPGTPIEGFARDRSFDAMVRWRQEQKVPVVMLGDWNATVWSAGYENLAQRTGTRSAVKGYGILNTWGVLPGPLGMTLDHQLYSPELVPVDTRLGPTYGSVHRSLMVDYRGAQQQSASAPLESGTAEPTG